MEITEVIVSILCAAPAQKMRARVTRDSAICAKSRAFSCFEGTSPVDEKRYPVTASYPDYGPCRELF